MMTRAPKAWFAPKRYGYGAGLPIAWQGWAVTILFVCGVAGSARLLHGARLAGALAALVIAFILVAARTTEGGPWCWRWGDDAS